MKRREANRHLMTVALGLVVPSALLGCSKGPTCTDLSPLSPDELRTRNETAKYVDQTPDASKKCSGCSLYEPAAPDQCGACKVVKGPINPNGYCTLWVAAPAKPS